MKVTVQHDKPDSWRVRRQRIKHAFILPFAALEWALEWIAYGLSQWTFLRVLEYLEGFSVLVAVIFYFSESGDRLKQKHYQAWQVINTAQGKGGNGGRIDALEELNTDGVALVGVDLTGAFLQGIHLEHARLRRANFDSSDVRQGYLNFAVLPDASLDGANFRDSHLNGADLEDASLKHADLTNADLSDVDFTGVSLTDADLTNANLANLRWSNIKDLKNANIYGVKNAPNGFVAWAKQHGAVENQPDSP
jgi:hypothetical protein